MSSFTQTTTTRPAGETAPAPTWRDLLDRYETAYTAYTTAIDAECAAEEALSRVPRAQPDLPPILTVTLPAFVRRGDGEQAGVVIEFPERTATFTKVEEVVAHHRGDEAAAAPMLAALAEVEAERARLDRESGRVAGAEALRLAGEAREEACDLQDDLCLAFMEFPTLDLEALRAKLKLAKRSADQDLEESDAITALKAVVAAITACSTSAPVHYWTQADFEALTETFEAERVKMNTSNYEDDDPGIDAYFDALSAVATAPAPGSEGVLYRLREQIRRDGSTIQSLDDMLAKDIEENDLEEGTRAYNYLDLLALAQAAGTQHPMFRDAYHPRAMIRRLAENGCIVSETGFAYPNSCTGAAMHLLNSGPQHDDHRLDKLMAAAWLDAFHDEGGWVHLRSDDNGEHLGVGMPVPPSDRLQELLDAICWNTAETPREGAALRLHDAVYALAKEQLKQRGVSTYGRPDQAEKPVTAPPSYATLLSSSELLAELAERFPQVAAEAAAAVAAGTASVMAAE